MSVSVVPASQPVKVLRLQQHRHMAPIHEGNVLGTPLIDQQVIDESSATTVMSRPALRTCPRLELVNELANHQDPQICFGIAATDGHDADRVCIFERSSHPAFARPRGSQAPDSCLDRSVRRSPVLNIGKDLFPRCFRSHLPKGFFLPIVVHSTDTASATMIGSPSLIQSLVMIQSPVLDDPRSSTCLATFAVEMRMAGGARHSDRSV